MLAGSAVTYAEPGYLLFRRSGKLMAQRFDARAMKLSGDPVALADAPPESEIDAEPIDWPVSRLFEIEDAVLQKLADLLNLVLTEPPQDRPTAWVRPHDSHAYSTVPSAPVRHAVIARSTFLCSGGMVAPNCSRYSPPYRRSTSATVGIGQGPIKVSIRATACSWLAVVKWR